MSWNNIEPIPSKKAFLDRAITKSKKIRGSSKETNIRKISSVSNFMNDNIKKIITSFPSLDELHTFYNELIKIRIDKQDLRKTLSRLNGTRKVVLRVSREMIQQKKTFNAFLGRVDSMLKEEVFEKLKEYRKIFRTFPDIKENLFTVCIAGFPNVGKSTLLNNLSDTKAEVNSYAFTTKKLNIGYIYQDYYTVQLIDTPGTLNREKMNNVEKQADLSMKYFSDKIIYVYDLTEAYPLKEQEKLDILLSQMYKNKITYYFSKQDILKKEKIKEFAKTHGIEDIYSLDEIKFMLIKEARKRRSIL